jgi:hypothetical protein
VSPRQDVHLVGREDDQAACGKDDPGLITFYWRKVTCPDCQGLIEQAHWMRTAAAQGGRPANAEDLYPR